MKEEIWKDIKGYEGLYQVSSFGRVKSLERFIDFKNKYGGGHMVHKPERLLKPKINKDGYLVVGLSKNGNIKYMLVSRLVAKTFLPNPRKLPEVNHKDEDKQNNRINNLEWCTRAYNNTYGILSKEGRRQSTKYRMKKIFQCTLDGKLLKIYNGIRIAEEETGIKNQSICRCCKGKQNTAGGFIWRYADE